LVGKGLVKFNTIERIIVHDQIVQKKKVVLAFARLFIKGVAVYQYMQQNTR